MSRAGKITLIVLIALVLLNTGVTLVLRLPRWFMWAGLVYLALLWLGFFRRL